VRSKIKTDANYALKVQEVLDADAIWQEVGKGFQFLSVPIQGLILFVTMLLNYLGYLGDVGAYVSVGLLAVILSALLLVKQKMVGRLDMQAGGSASVQKMLNLGIRSSISFAIMIIVVCTMI
jgi:hypothetical protein